MQNACKSAGQRLTPAAYAQVCSTQIGCLENTQCNPYGNVSPGQERSSVVQAERRLLMNQRRRSNHASAAIIIVLLVSRRIRNLRMP